MIHTDFERGFIKAEIVSFDDLVAAGSMAAAKAAGKVRMEGKDYVMQDGDVVEFRHGSPSRSSLAQSVRTRKGKDDSERISFVKQDAPSASAAAPSTR